MLCRHLLLDETPDVYRVVVDPKRAQLPNEVVPIGGRPGAELIVAEDLTFDSLLVALADLESQTNPVIHAIDFCAQPEVAQRARPI